LLTQQEYIKETKRYLSSRDDDLPDYPAPPASATAHETTPRASLPGLDGAPGKKEGKPKPGKKKTFKLEEVERWTMVKRIW
jgi:hypothetical protein